MGKPSTVGGIWLGIRVNWLDDVSDGAFSVKYGPVSGDADPAAHF